MDIYSHYPLLNLQPWMMDLENDPKILCLIFTIFLFNLRFYTVSREFLLKSKTWLWDRFLKKGSKLQGISRHIMFRIAYFNWISICWLFTKQKGKGVGVWVVLLDKWVSWVYFSENTSAENHTQDITLKDFILLMYVPWAASCKNRSYNLRIKNSSNECGDFIMCSVCEKQELSYHLSSRLWDPNREPWSCPRVLVRTSWLGVFLNLPLCKKAYTRQNNLISYEQFLCTSWKNPFHEIWKCL